MFDLKTYVSLVYYDTVVYYYYTGMNIATLVVICRTPMLKFW